MTKGKSSLNADAAPYVPIPEKKKMCVSGKNEGVGYDAGFQLPGNVSLGQSLEALHIADKSSSDIVHSYSLEGSTIHDSISATEKQSMTEGNNMMIDFLMSRFPGYGAESLADLLNYNHGDLEETIDLLEICEDRHASAEAPGASEFHDNASPSSRSPSAGRAMQAGLLSPSATPTSCPK